jgi:probable addiction module antidote protein
MSKRKFRIFEEVQIEHYKKHPKDLKIYIAVALEEFQKDGDEEAFLSALALAAKVRGGFGKVAKTSGISREHLYRALSEKGDPRLSTFVQVIQSLGLSLKVA